MNIKKYQQSFSSKIPIHYQNTRRYFKYGSDNRDLGWANWQINQPNNSGKRCVGVDLQFLNIQWRQRWFDSGCYDRMAVLCQADEKLKVAEGKQ